MPKLYADLHAHPTMYGFNRMRNDPAFENDESKFHPWYMLPENLKHMDAGKRGATYSQSDFPKCAKAGMRLMFALLTGVTLITAAWKGIRHGKFAALTELTRILRNHAPVRRFLQTKVMRISAARVAYLQSSQFDYWEEYLKEYEFYKKSNGQRKRTSLQYSVGGQETQEDIEGCFHLIQEREQLTRLIESDTDEIAVILTIEGGHVLSMDPHRKRVPDDLLFERIEALKSQEHPVFFITFAHHFDNGLCGHAHSILDAAAALIDQTPRMHEGFAPERDLGFRAACALLAIDATCEPQEGRRILLDVKHMSAQTRRQYYDRIIRPYQALHATWDDDKQKRYPCIPVIVSHACYSGIQTLEAMEANVDKENDHWHVAPFYAWNINLCDEDIEVIFESRGLIGFCFEQRIAGIAPQQKLPLEHYADLLLSHLFAMVDVILLDERRPLEERIKIWDCICLGTDYDGFIDPLTAYPTVLSLDQMTEDLILRLTAHRHTRQIGAIGVEELVEKITWRNAYEFTKKHWPV